MLFSYKQYNIYDKKLFTTRDNRLKLFSVEVRKLYLNNKLPSCFLCAYSNKVFRTSIVRFRTDKVLEVRKGDATQITVYCCGAGVVQKSVIEGPWASGHE